MTNEILNDDMNNEKGEIMGHEVKELTRDEKADLLRHLREEFLLADLAEIADLLMQDISTAEIRNQAIAIVKRANRSGWDQSIEPYELMIACIDEGELISYAEWAV